MDVHLPRPGWREEDLGLPMGQGTLTALRIREGGGHREGEGKGRHGGGGKLLINK